MTPSGGDVPRLTVRGGLHDGLSIALDSPGADRVLGSDPQSDLRLESPAVSALHARFLYEQGEARIVDANSLSGTFVNGKRVETSVPLADSDRVSLGAPGSADAVTLVAHVPGRPRAAAPPRRPTAQDYLTEPPSMVPEGHDLDAYGPDDDELPPMAPPPALPLPRPATPPMSKVRMAQLGGGAAALGLLLFFVARSLLSTSPAIHGVLPPRVEPGQTLTLVGTGFDSAGEVRIVAGDTEVAPSQIEPGQLKFEVPIALAASAPTKVPVRIVADGSSSSAVYIETFLAPDILALEPDVALPGDEVVARGEHLGADGIDLTVGGIGAELLETSPTRVRFRVPELSWESGRSAPVAARVETTRSQPVPLIFGRLPLVTGISPERGAPGQVVRIEGRGLEGDVSVTFGGEEAVVLSASPSEVRVLAPSGGVGAGTRPLPVAVRLGTREAMSSVSFTPARHSSNLYRPRFFPQPVAGMAAEERLDVATELGPLLRLSGRAGTPSTANRAARVAEALNALVSADENLRLEVRQTNVGPAVAVVGRNFPIVTVTAEDAAAYSNGPTPDQLARFWRALIDDVFDLFVRGRRPMRSAGLTAHAEVLVRLQSDALRRSSGLGVPMAVVQPPSRDLLEGWRRLALDFPSKAPPNAAIVVVGRWEGSYKEKDQPERRVVVELRLAGGRLRGTLSAGSGRIVGEVPLDDLAFENGRLRFSMDAGGRQRRFEGPLEGLSVEGDITEGSGGARIGRFSLVFQS